MVRNGAAIKCTHKFIYFRQTHSDCIQPNTLIGFFSIASSVVSVVVVAVMERANRTPSSGENGALGPDYCVCVN